jgi:hypothetical protein
MTSIFIGLRDLHTLYLAPDPYRRQIAFLPFMIEEYHEAPAREGGEPVRVYFISKVARPVRHHLRPGALVKFWNGIPIERALELNALRNGGANHDARQARGLETLTSRWLGASALPDEDWITLTVADPDEPDALRELRCPWLLGLPPAPASQKQQAQNGPRGAEISIDSGLEMRRRLKLALYADPGRPQAPSPASALTSRCEALACRRLPDDDGPFGYLRIWTFDVDDVDVFVDEARRLLGELDAVAPSGLVIDLRGNPGGVMAAGDGLLAALAPGPIELEPLQYIANPTTLRFARALASEDTPLQAFATADTVSSLALGIETGMSFSNARPIAGSPMTDPRGQAYQGRKLLIVDALCYSTADIFACGFQDHELGHIMGTHGQTGGGGANVWSYEQLRDQLGDELPELPSPGANGTPAVPASFSIALRRTLRVKERAGTLVEGAGAQPSVNEPPYRLTRNDVMFGNRDLLAHATTKLQDDLLYSGLTNRLDAEPDPEGGWKVRAKQLSRVEVVSDGHVVAQIDDPDGRHVDDPGGAIVLLRGYDKFVTDEPRVSRLVRAA